MGGIEQTPALPDQFAIMADHLVVAVWRCTCDGPFETYGHRRECGYEPIMTLDELAVVLSRAGRTVLELPEPAEQDPAMWEAVTDANPYWRVDPDADEYGPWVRCELGHHYLDPANAAQLGAALIACARESERLASESSGDTEHTDGLDTTDCPGCAYEGGGSGE
jgi:hypothetical protein